MSGAPRRGARARSIGAGGERTPVELRRADASAIDPGARDAALRELGVGPGAWIATGTEAEVYGLTDERVVKLYADTRRAGKLESLRRFYDSVRGERLKFALPRIYDITPVRGLLAVTERRIEGKPLSELLPALDAGDALRARERYIDAVVALAELEAPHRVSRYLLLDESGTSSVRAQGWCEFVYRLAQVKIERHRASLQADVIDLPAKEARLRELYLGRKYDGPLRVVHGDFFPGNVLMSDAERVSGVIDFGSFTMLGDPLYDVSLACMFFDMVGPERSSVRDELIAVALRRVGAAAEGKLYRYAMAYALMSCDLYAGADGLRQDGHYRWAVDLLNTEPYWQRMA
ncbi:aminoglycoside phosphotransferase family protein [Sorangium sp. So ce542]|uniref:aminoglycoside phosphotransferase family protein n=1 Tax=Sorangium sp. So ce542 TaxID=3133316 RepID=UPI003F60B66E